LRAALRGNDLAARLGGDEFGAAARPAQQDHAVEVAGASWRHSTSRSSAGETVGVGASIGIAVDTPTSGTVDDLLGDADIAMYRAKAQGKGRYHVFRETDPDARAARDQAWVERGPTVRRRESLRITEPRLAEPRLEPTAG
jgi:predicted signal transduction protein with EAL and GGDEF domain